MKTYFLIYKEKEIELASGKEITIGRNGHGADLEIDDSSASRTHGRIKSNEKGIFIEDTGSVNGIYVNGQKIPPHTLKAISEHDEIKIISERLKLTAASSSETDGKTRISNRFQSAEKSHVNHIKATDSISSFKKKILKIIP